MMHFSLLVPRPLRSAGTGDYWIRVCLSVCPSVRPSVRQHFRTLSIPRYSILLGRIKWNHVLIVLCLFLYSFLLLIICRKGGILHIRAHDMIITRGMGKKYLPNLKGKGSMCAMSEGNYHDMEPWLKYYFY